MYDHKRQAAHWQDNSSPSLGPLDLTLFGSSLAVTGEFGIHKIHINNYDKH